MSHALARLSTSENMENGRDAVTGVRLSGGLGIDGLIIVEN
jgi:hypothetical protein